MCPKMILLAIVFSALLIASQCQMPGVKQINDDRLRIEQLLKQLQSERKTETFNLGCLEDTTLTSNCTWIPRIGCYCVVQESKTLPEAKEYCANRQMKLAAFETKKEWEHVADFLRINLGSREGYDFDFWTSGTSEQGAWWWDRTNPLTFRKWNASSPNRNRRPNLVVTKSKPFRWIQAGNSGSAYFICEEIHLGSTPPRVESALCPVRIRAGSTCTFLDRLGCYCIVQVQETRTSAEEECKANKMALVSVETDYEQDQLSGFLWENKPGNSYRLDFWTSGIRNKQNGRWTWTTTGQPVRYSSWRNGQPNVTKGVEQAIALSAESHDWVSSGTDRNAFYVCERSWPMPSRRIGSKPCTTTKPGWICRQGTSCYCLRRNATSWDNSRNLCRSLGMDLVSIDSSTEEAALVDILPKNIEPSVWWTSGSDAAVEGSWKWTSTGRSMRYANWALGQPDNKNRDEHFLAVQVKNNRTSWFDRPASYGYRVLCEK